MKFEDLNLPATWQVKPINEVYTFTKKPRGLNVGENLQVPFLPMDAIPIGRLHVSAFEERPTSHLASGTYIEDGDLLVAKITPSFENGKQAIVNWMRPYGFATTEVIPIQEIEGVSSKYFLFHLLLHPEIRSDLAGKMDGTTGRQRLSKEVLGGSLIPVPPLGEQRKIAGVLGLVQRAIEQQERLLALTVELKKALLHRLFTRGLRDEPLKETEIGPVPESWHVVPMGVVATFQTGGTPSREKSEYWEGGDIPWVKTTEIDYKLILTKQERVTPDGLRYSAAKVFPAGTLLVAMYGQGVTRGRVAMLGIHAATNQACAAITPNDECEISTRFIYYFLQYHYEALRRMGHGANQSNLNMALLRGFPIAYPLPDEQAVIVEALTGLDEKRDVQHRKHSVLKTLFRALLHQLMTAQIRVHDLDLHELEAVTGK